MCIFAVTEYIPKYAIREIKTDSAKANVGRALPYSEVLGPFFYVEEAVTAMTYLDML
jgi:hypothetical protein